MSMTGSARFPFRPPLHHDLSFFVEIVLHVPVFLDYCFDTMSKCAAGNVPVDKLHPGLPAVSG
jgi:hypothetical protein